MTGQVIERVKEECTRRGAQLIRLDTGADEPVVHKIYLGAGVEIVKILEHNGRFVMLLYELKL